MFRKRVKLPQTQESFNACASKFLLENGFEDTNYYHRIFATFIQHLPDDTDSFDSKKMARMIRKYKAQGFAFYLIHPDKLEKKQEDEQSEKTSSPVV